MDELSKWRSEVIESSINIEWLINAIICQHYLKKICRIFLFEVFYDEYFNFGFKKKNITKISPLLLSRFLLDVKVLGRGSAKTPSNPAFGRTHRQLIRIVRFCKHIG